MRRILPLVLPLVSALVVAGCLHAPMPWSPDGKWIAYTVEVRPTAGLLRPGWLFESPTVVPIASAPASNRPIGYRIWASRADSGESVLLEDSPLPLTAPGWSPDGRALAFGRMVAEPEGRGRFEVVILDGPNRRRIVSSRSLIEIGVEASKLPGQAIAWSPDGRFLAIPQFNPLGMAIVRADNGRQVNAINDAFLPSWSPDGSRLAFFVRGTGDTLSCIDSPTGQARILTEVGQAGQAAIWTRDGLNLVLAARRSVPRGGESPVDQVEMIKVRCDNGHVDTIRALSEDTSFGRNRAVEGVSIAVDRDGENLFRSMVVEATPQQMVPHQITWYHSRNNSILVKFSILDYTVPMGSLSLSPDGHTLAARVGSLDRLTAPALCDLESTDLRSRLLAPDDDSRVEWIATLVGAARGILSVLPIASDDPKVPTSSRLDRVSLLPVASEFEATSEQVSRLRRIGRLGRPVCDRPVSAPPPTPEVAALLDEARFFFEYLSENYTAAARSLEILEARAETPDQRLRLLCLRAQIFLGQGDFDHADKTIRYLEKLDHNAPRTLEWTGEGYVVTGTGPTPARGWPSYLAWKSTLIRAKLRDEEDDTHFNPDGPRVNFGIDPKDLRQNQVFPDRPFLNDVNPPDPPSSRRIPLVRPQMPVRELPEGVPKL